MAERREDGTDSALDLRASLRGELACFACYFLPLRQEQRASTPEMALGRRVRFEVLLLPEEHLGRGEQPLAGRERFSLAGG